MEFEFDPRKSVSNLKKHGVDFDQAQELWRGPYIEFAAKRIYENRFAVIGAIGKELYTCIFAVRGECIRIISCRRSGRKERKLYEKNIKETQID